MIEYRHLVGECFSKRMVVNGAARNGRPVLRTPIQMESEESESFCSLPKKSWKTPKVRGNAKRVPWTRMAAMITRQAGQPASFNCFLDREGASSIPLARDGGETSNDTLGSLGLKEVFVFRSGS